MRTVSYTHLDVYKRQVPSYSYPYYSTSMVAYETSSNRLFYLAGNDFAKPGFRKAVALVEKHMASGKLPKDEEE